MNHICAVCRQPQSARRHLTYVYTACGLANAILNNVEVRTCGCGDAVVIPDVDGLHQAIAAALLMTAGPLNPAEIAYLRKFVDGLVAGDVDITPPIQLRCDAGRWHTVD
ncbi:MAG: hypothetical protein IPJ61_18675 [Tessaracoccus sp.]|uniref:hypothetical protein n=1 Tax=Tessaracoccus sp. TaxID=1971211 RepID=UPI001EC608A6|nr:hypothetical protein [Tessaracoccus sp.]MBK7823010.1 hypothetical protein [Tessaracoccus sp.]